MRNIIKSIVNKTWKPYVEWYLRAPRNFKYKNISLQITPGVFHPGFFFSTKLMISFLEKQKLKNVEVLEIGCGSGMISIFAAKNEAHVTATDIFSTAIENAKANAALNKQSINFIESDLFLKIPPHQFDLIVVNPPYYKKDPITPEQHAWYCGEQMEYFEKFFSQAKLFVKPQAEIIMVLSDECDLEGIRKIAEKNNWNWEMALKKKTGWETGFIFRICSAKDEIK